MFSCFGTIQACDGRTGGQTDRHIMTAYTALAQHRAVKTVVSDYWTVNDFIVGE